MRPVPLANWFWLSEFEKVIFLPCARRDYCVQQPLKHIFDILDVYERILEVIEVVGNGKPEIMSTVLTVKRLARCLSCPISLFDYAKTHLPDLSIRLHYVSIVTGGEWSGLVA